ncbi:hypothetical protein HPP92_007861 [Vanilla planifolia]|uniref:Protein kinase domain-containing protein n=1 Tax=Vanilla planifolia TaxID=51239 RepID=A0A835RRQ9_VANPL|nr:hypothetical protein HPP92_007861 [Vanilla planifolia]
MATAGTAKWMLGRTLGHGATATVSLATDPASGNLFAVKSSPISCSAMLRKEESILSSLSSPHVIASLGSDVSGEYYHLFLELAVGGTLSDLAGRIEESKIRSFTHQILLGLCYLHSEGIAHCDVKGRNVLVGSDGRVKLGDLGCARYVEDGGGLRTMGTPAFMAPEVARGEEQWFPGDIWSLGCTVVEMATGKSAWPEIADPVSVIHHIGFSSAVPVIPAWLSEEGKDFILKCLQRDPKQRWTAEQLLCHPFVAVQESPLVLCSSSMTANWVSPKSTLEVGLWDSEAEEDEERSIDVSELSSDRIRELVSLPLLANWTWTESWVSVRSSAGECYSTPDQNAVDDLCCSNSSSTESEVETKHVTDHQSSNCGDDQTDPRTTYSHGACIVWALPIEGRARATIAVCPRSRAGELLATPPASSSSGLVEPGVLPWLSYI